jgi:methyltransferase
MMALPAPVAAGLAAFLVVLAVERAIELQLSARNAARARARGGTEHGRGHFALFVALHALLPFALIAEVGWMRARPGPTWPLWLALFLLGQALRVWAIRTLGERWNVRVWVVPGEPPIRRGPYRWLRHPNYLAVVLELLAGPMMFGAWRTAVAASALNVVALAVRIPVEERALGLR